MTERRPISSIELGTLKQRALRTTGWMIAGHGFGQAIRLGSNLIMTRLLVPEMFGIMALAHVLLVGLTLFSDLGINQNIVQSKRGNDPTFLNTAWAVAIVRGVVICLFMLSLGLGVYSAGQMNWLPPGTAYAAPELPTVISLIGTIAIFDGLKSTNWATATRVLKVGRIMQIEVGTQAISVCTMIVFAMVSPTIWALICGNLVGGILKPLLTHIVLPGPTNRWCWDRSALSEIIGFGKWVFISSILGYLIKNIDRLLLGVLIDARTLGVFVIALFMADAIKGIFQRISDTTAFASFSEIVRTRPNELEAVYYRVRYFLDATSMFIGGILFVLSNLIIEILYDDRYVAAGTMLQIMSISIALSPIYLCGCMYLAIGKPRLLVPFQSIRLIVILILIPILFLYIEIHGVILAILIADIVGIGLFYKWKLQQGILRPTYELRGIPFVVAGVLLGTLVLSFIPDQVP